MWILLMIVLSQPYQVNYIKVLGDYPSKDICLQDRVRALEIHGKGKFGPASFGCIKVIAAKRKDNKYEMGFRKEFDL